MALAVEGRVQLLVSREGQHYGHFSTLVGYVRDEYLLVRVPYANGLPIVLYEGETVSVRVFSGVDVHVFDVDVTHVWNLQLGCVQLDFPREIRTTALRREIRVKVALPARVHSDAVGTPLAATLRNISVAGALVETQQPLGDIATRVQIEFAATTADMASEFAAAGTIRNARERKSAGSDTAPASLEYGIELDPLDADQRIRMQNLIYHTLIRNRHAVV